MKRLLNITFLIFITLNSLGQNIMLRNENRSDTLIIENQKLVSKIQKSQNDQSDIRLYVEKIKDSVYTIYLLNDSKDSLSIDKQDWSFFMVMEAKDEKGEWKPIEFWLHSDCGNSYSYEKLGSKKILKSESLAYNGNFKTKIRFKILNDNKEYYSNSITGNVNFGQFIIPAFETNELFSFWFKRVGAKTMEDIIFLKPNGKHELVKMNTEYLARMAELRKQNEN